MPQKKGPSDLLALLKKSQSFAENLLTENEQLRLKLAALEERNRAAENERDGLRNRIESIQMESSRSARSFQEIDEELNALANLHVATWQLHASLDPGTVVNTVVEICINLVGAEEAIIYVEDETTKTLVPVNERPSGLADPVVLGVGVIGTAVQRGKVQIQEKGDPRVVVPLRLGNRVLGAVVIHAFLMQKKGLTSLDRQLFDLIADQGSTALYGAYLAATAGQPMRPAALRAALNRPRESP